MTQAQIEREQYESRWKKQLDHQSALNESKRSLEEGFKQGMQQGMQQGIERGIEQGAKLGQISRIHAYERLLKRPETPRDSLLALPVDQLAKIGDNLEMELATVFNATKTS